jgi:hypothetical protein
LIFVMFDWRNLLALSFACCHTVWRVICIDELVQYVGQKDRLSIYSSHVVWKSIPSMDGIVVLGLSVIYSLPSTFFSIRKWYTFLILMDRWRGAYPSDVRLMYNEVGNFRALILMERTVK